MSEAESIRKEEHHQYVVEMMADFYRPLLETSSDGIMVFLDDEHKICNQNLADMFGYGVDEWMEATPFIETFIAPESRAQVATTYRHVRERGVSARFEATCTRLDDSTFRAEMAIVPIIAGDDFFTVNLFKQI